MRGTSQNQAQYVQSESSRSAPAVSLSGWTVFSGVLLLLAGAFGAINGVIALLNSEVYVVTDKNIVLFDLTQWGWIHVIGGGFVAIIGLVVLGTGATWARMLGVCVAMLQAIAQVSFIEAYPFWTLATIALDIAVIYGLLVQPQKEYPPLRPAPR
jgi:hypothetical protein